MKDSSVNSLAVRSAIGLLTTVMVTHTPSVYGERSQASMKVLAVVANAATVTATALPLIDRARQDEIRAATDVRVLAPVGTSYKVTLHTAPGVEDNSHGRAGERPSHPGLLRSPADAVTAAGQGRRPLAHHLYGYTSGEPTLRIHLDF